MSFRSYFNDATAYDFSTGRLPNFLLNLEPDDIFMESDDLIRQGYRLITGKYPPYEGQKVWWKKGERVIPAQEAPQAPRAASPAPAPSWVLAHVLLDSGNLRKGQKVALSKRPDGSWDVADGMGRVTNLSPDVVSTTVQSVRDPQGKAIKGESPAALLSPMGALPGPNPKTPKSKKSKKDNNLIPEDRISQEQRDIDQQFGEIMKSPGQSHLMIRALAGTGKTTMLKHLAWKYGRPGQKWIYIVFNKKNKVEAKTKFPQFPHEPSVEVETTNSFLGKIIGSKENQNRIPQTERIIELPKFAGGGGGDDDERLDKGRILLDGPEFGQVLSGMGIIPAQVSSDYGRMTKTLTSLIKSIHKELKEQITTLTGLVKSFAIDPRDHGRVAAGIQQIMGSYDFDTDLSEVKDRIRKYSSPAYREAIQQALQSILGFDFMARNFRGEIIEGANWLLQKTMPHATDQRFRFGNISHPLGLFRDFNDDLWFAAVHANEIHWPHYDVVLADEVQDFNACQQIMLRKLHEAGAKIVAVGDENQAIYRFRGADSEAFNHLSGMLGELSGGQNVEYPLSANYRSRKAIIDFSNEATHVKNLKQGKVFDDGDEGEVTNELLQYDEIFSQLGQEKTQTGKVKQTAFISRTNDPLIHAALKLMANNIPFEVVGKDIAKDLRKHISRILGRYGVKEHDPASALSERLEEFRSTENDFYEGQSAKKAYIQGLNETTDALLASLGQFLSDDGSGGDGYSQQRYGAAQREPTIDQFKKWLFQRLGGLDIEFNEKDLKTYQERMEKEQPVVLTTAHRSKGLEFERVFILRNDLFPHPKATRPEDLAQEANSQYVAYTRAMDQLHIVKLDGQPGYKPPQKTNYGT